MFISWLLGIPFGDFFDARFILAVSAQQSPSLPLIVAMIAVLIGMWLAARTALNY